jgi:hypothetical protein
VRMRKKREGNCRGGGDGTLPTNNHSHNGKITFQFLLLLLLPPSPSNSREGFGCASPSSTPLPLPTPPATPPRTSSRPHSALQTTSKVSQAAEELLEGVGGQPFSLPLQSRVGELAHSPLFLCTLTGKEGPRTRISRERSQATTLAGRGRVRLFLPSFSSYLPLTSHSPSYPRAA